MTNKTHDKFEESVRVTTVANIQAYADEHGTGDFEATAPQAIAGSIFIASEVLRTMGHGPASVALMLRNIADALDDYQATEA